MTKNTWENNNTLLRESNSPATIKYYYFYSRDIGSDPWKEFDSEREALDYAKDCGKGAIEKHTWYDIEEFNRYETADLREIIWKAPVNREPSFTEEEEYWSRPSVIKETFSNEKLDISDYGVEGKTHAYYIDCHYSSDLYKKLTKYFKQHGIQPISCMCSKPRSVREWMSGNYYIGYRKENNEYACTLCRPRNLRNN